MNGIHLSRAWAGLAGSGLLRKLGLGGSPRPIAKAIKYKPKPRLASSPLGLRLKSITPAGAIRWVGAKGDAIIAKKRTIITFCVGKFPASQSIGAKAACVAKTLYEKTLHQED
jgi:hypothetical protein